jgi:RHS repeat-associated protein
MMQTKSGAVAKNYFIHANSLYSVQAVTDSAGAVVEQYTYSAYGDRKIVGSTSRESAIGLTVGFTGLRNEGDLVFARGRYLSPSLGRWIARDPAGYVDGYSLYRGYFAPNGLDPSGQRNLTPEEMEQLLKLKELLASSNAAGDKEFSKALNAVIKDWVSTINSIKEGDSDPVTIKIVGKALTIWADKDQSKSYAVSSGIWSAGANKCNYYVADVVKTVKTPLISVPGRWFGTTSRVPLAGEWANEKLNFGGFDAVWEIKPTKDSTGGTLKIVLQFPMAGKPGARIPLMGDVVSFGNASSEQNMAHVGVYLGADLYISATGSSVLGQDDVVIKFAPKDAQRLLFRSIPSAP